MIVLERSSLPGFTDSCCGELVDKARERIWVVVRALAL